MGGVVLISTYDLGRQPFGLASPAAWLREAGAHVTLQDLAISELDPEPVRDAVLVAIHVPMHTATRMAEPVLARVRELNPSAHLCVYGLYAPMNADHLRRLGADTVLGGEFEEPLARLYRAVGTPGNGGRRSELPMVSMGRQEFLLPDRAGLPDLRHYAGLQTAPERVLTVGYTEATRGCKHLCRHCPIVPVYGGRFRVVQTDVVLADIRQQVAAGAEHITFGDPDFFNAPGHAVRIVDRLHAEFRGLSYDVTVKVEHLCRHQDLLPVLSRTGCALVTTAVEALDDAVLTTLDKGHTVADLDQALALLRAHAITVNPTFVAFTPWTTLAGYTSFLRGVADRCLVDLVSPVQYGIRLLVPEGSRLLELDDMRAMLDGFDPQALAHRWSNPDPRVDELQQEVLSVVRAGQQEGLRRREIFARVWQVAAAATGPDPTAVDLSHLPAPRDVPHLTEPWYCCAEPIDEQVPGL